METSLLSDWDFNGKEMRLHNTETKKTLMYISGSTNVFRADGEYSASIHAFGLCIKTQGLWENIRVLLDSIFPTYNFINLELPPHESPRKMTREEYLAMR